MGVLNPARMAIGVAIFAVTLLGSSGLAAVILCQLPADYLTPRTDAAVDETDRPVRPRLAKRIGKNLLGALLVVIGVVLSFPGVPGQGLLTILVGVLLLDVPGKRRIESQILGIPTVLSGVNRLRKRFGRAPLAMPESAAQ